MKIVKFLGGLGNQMFQYAFYLGLKHRFGIVKADLNAFNNYDLHHGFELEKIFNVTLTKATAFESRLYGSDDQRFITRKLRRLFGTKHACHVEKRYFGFENEIFADTTTRYYWGYWQNVNYFKEIKPAILEEFQFRIPEDEQNADLLDKIKANNSVSVHVRRGDYLSNELLGNICDLPYYHQALDIVKSKVANPFFVIFSNDIGWCQQNLVLNNCIYVDWNQGERSYLDMKLMSACKHNIIANSSFSWWAAYLNANSEKLVIMPGRWMNMPELDYSGLILEGWKAI